VRPILPPYPADCLEQTIRQLAERAEACGALAVRHENLATMHEAARLALLAQIHRLTTDAGAMFDAAETLAIKGPTRPRRPAKPPVSPDSCDEPAEVVVPRLDLCAQTARAVGQLGTSTAYREGRSVRTNGVARSIVKPTALHSAHGR
jgi:hypothetical protein